MRLLADFGYPAADQTAPLDFERCISKRLKAMTVFIKDITPNAPVSDLWFSRFDYHNLKSIIKAELTGTSATRTMINAGTIEPTKLRDYVREKNYSMLPGQMREGLRDLDSRLSIKNDTAYIGLILDSAYARQVTQVVAQTGDEVAIRFYKADIDFINIRTIIRLKRSNVSREVFERGILPGGTINKTVLNRAYEAGGDDICEILGRGRFEKELNSAYEHYKATGELTMLEKQRNDYLLKIAGEKRHDMFCSGPMLYYMTATLRETQVVRMIMLAKLGGLDTKTIGDIVPSLG